MSAATRYLQKIRKIMTNWIWSNLFIFSFNRNSGADSSFDGHHHHQFPVGSDDGKSDPSLYFSLSFFIHLLILFGFGVTCLRFFFLFTMAHTAPINVYIRFMASGCPEGTEDLKRISDRVGVSVIFSGLTMAKLTEYIYCTIYIVCMYVSVRYRRRKMQLLLGKDGGRWRPSHIHTEMQSQ
jgi:hypothetical protein